MTHGHKARHRYVLVVSLASYDPMCTLFFTHLRDRLPLRIVQFPGDDIVEALAGASAVIVVRGLFEFGNLFACLKLLGLPRYYFLDDNFMIIREEAGLYGSLYEKYSGDRVREVLRDFSGVLLATPSLIEYFRTHHLHDRLMLYPPVAGPRLATPARTTDRPLRIAFFGGLHRREPFVRYVYPAVCRIARGTPVTLVAAGIEARSLAPADGLEIIYPRYDAAYTQSLQIVAGHGVDILVHPSIETANNAYKNPHVLINACALGAIPVFSNMAPYDAVAGEEVAVLCENTEDAWFDALQRVAGDPAMRAVIGTRLVAFCERHFAGDRNTKVIDAMLAAHPAPTPQVRMTRRFAAAAFLGVGRAQRLIARQFSPAE